MKRLVMYIEIAILLIVDICLILLFFPKRVEVLGEKFDPRSQSIDISELDTSDINKYINNFDYFYNLKSVQFGSNKISYDDKYNLMMKYPNINFQVKSVINIYGKEYDDDVTYIDLSDVEVDSNLSKYLKEFNNLEKVNLHNQDLTNEEKLNLKEQFPSVEFEWHVKLFGKEYYSDLNSLSLVNRKDIDIKELYHALKLFPNLKTLDMADTNLTNEELGKLREDFPNIKIDWMIYIGKWHLRTDAKAFSVLVVNYDYVRLTSEDLEVFKYCTELEALDLGHQNITDISKLISYTPNLRVLILADNKIEDISPLRKLKYLHYLEVFLNKIQDISPLEDCKGLVDLNISYNKITDITPILDLPKLERLWAVNIKIGNEGFNKLYETYPNVEISRYGKGSTDGTWRHHKRYFTMIDMYKKNYISEEFTKYD